MCVKTEEYKDKNNKILYLKLDEIKDFKGIVRD